MNDWAHTIHSTRQFRKQFSERKIKGKQMKFVQINSNTQTLHIIVTPINI